jgi:hypothetical protein
MSVDFGAFGGDVLAKAANKARAADEQRGWGPKSLMIWSSALVWAALAVAQELRYIREELRKGGGTGG